MQDSGQERTGQLDIYDTVLDRYNEISISMSTLTILTRPSLYQRLFEQGRALSNSLKNTLTLLSRFEPLQVDGLRQTPPQRGTTEQHRDRRVHVIILQWYPPGHSRWPRLMKITFQRISRRGSIVQGNQSRYAYQVNRLLTSFNDSVWTLMEGLSD